MNGGFLGPVFARGLARREKVSLLTAGILVAIPAFFLPPPHQTIVDGHLVREVVLLGYVVPDRLLGVGLAVSIGVLGLLTWTLYGKLWPEPQAEEATCEKTFPMAGGGTITWKPDVPGTPSLIEYDTTTFSPATTAKEYLWSEGPDPMRVMMVGTEQWGRESWEHEELVAAWLETAPESTLRELIETAEPIFSGEHAGFHENVAYRLVDASEERGIPSRQELADLADRIAPVKIARILRFEADGDS